MTAHKHTWLYADEEQVYCPECGEERSTIEADWSTLMDDIVRAIRTEANDVKVEAEVQYTAPIGHGGAAIIVKAETDDGEYDCTVEVVDDETLRLPDIAVAAERTYAAVVYGGEVSDGHRLEHVPLAVADSVIDWLSEGAGTFECDACRRTAIRRHNSGGYGYSYDEGTFCDACSNPRRR